MYGKNLPENNKLQHIKPMPSFWRLSVPISKKLEIFLHRLCLGYTYPTYLLFLINHPVPACTHCRNPVIIKHMLAECAFHSRLTQKLQFPESYEDIFLPTHMDRILKIHQGRQLHPQDILSCLLPSQRSWHVN